MIVYISIGNSDDKLSQLRWGKFWRKVDLTIQGYRNSGLQVHGRWVSQSTDFWQNACWCVDIQEMGSTLTNLLRSDLRRLARDFNQNSIAWAVTVETEFIDPLGSE